MSFFDDWNDTPAIATTTPAVAKNPVVTSVRVEDVSEPRLVPVSAPPVVSPDPAVAADPILSTAQTETGAAAQTIDAHGGRVRVDDKAMISTLR